MFILEVMNTVKQIQDQMRRLGDVESARQAARYFKTGAGEYGAGDVFLGMRAATLHELARTHQTLNLKEVDGLLRSPVHEVRSLALLILVRQMPKADKGERRRIHEYYLANTERVNNWDLVDCSAPEIVGGYLHDKSRRPLHRLSRSKLLWDRRIAIVATLYLIRNGDCQETLTVTKRLLNDDEDLIHKAAGWMLREVGSVTSPFSRAS